MFKTICELRSKQSEKKHIKMRENVPDESCASFILPLSHRTPAIVRQCNFEIPCALIFFHVSIKTLKRGRTANIKLENFSSYYFWKLENHVKCNSFCCFLFVSLVESILGFHVLPCDLNFKYAGIGFRDGSSG